MHGHSSLLGFAIKIEKLLAGKAAGQLVLTPPFKWINADHILHGNNLINYLKSECFIDNVYMSLIGKKQSRF